ncbi:MAG: ABC transporter substrate-binding protein, partial [Marinobacter sp.]
MSQQTLTPPNLARRSAITRPVWMLVALVVFSLMLPGVARASDKTSVPALSVSVLQFGTAHWELDHILHR